MLCANAKCKVAIRFCKAPCKVIMPVGRSDLPPTVKIENVRPVVTLGGWNGEEGAQVEGFS